MLKKILRSNLFYNMVITFYEFLVYIVAYIGLFATSFYVIHMIKSRKKVYVMKDDKTVSIIIPAYNEAKSIAQTIDSALALDYSKERLEIIVVDDGSKDDTYKIAKKYETSDFPIIRVFTKLNGGKGSALNFGIDKSKSDIIITMDADTFANPDALKKMIGRFHSPEVMAVTPSMGVYKPKGILQKVQQIEYYLGVFLRKSFANINAIHVTPGAFSAYRREFFVKYGGYDTTNITEDLEICLRMQSKNYTVENAPEAVIYTHVPNKFKSLMYQRRRWYTGLTSNLWAYRHLFSPRYGALGILVLPNAVISVILSVFLSFYAVVLAFIQTRKDLLNLIAINFQFKNVIELNSFVFTHFLYTLFSLKIFLITLLFLTVMAFYLYFSERKMKHKEGVKISFIWFLYLYSLLFAFWWFISFVYTLFKKKVEWRENK